MFNPYTSKSVINGFINMAFRPREGVIINHINNNKKEYFFTLLAKSSLETVLNQFCFCITLAAPTFLLSTKLHLPNVKVQASDYLSQSLKLVWKHSCFLQKNDTLMDSVKKYWYIYTNNQWDRIPIWFLPLL